MQREELNPNRLFNYRPVFEAAVAFASSVAVAQLLSHDWRILLALLFAAASAFLFFIKNQRLGLFFAFCAIGISALIFATPKNISTGEHLFSGVVVSIEQDETGTEIILANVKVDSQRFTKQLLLRLKPNSKMETVVPISVGDEASSIAYVDNTYKTFGTYNEYLSLMSRGIGVVATSDNIRQTSTAGHAVIRLSSGIRNSLQNKADATFGEYSPLISALIIGTRNAVTGDQYDLYRQSGTAHLLNISGFHIGVICMMVLFIIPKRAKYLRLISCTVVLCIYISVTFFAPSMVRAAIMCITGLVGIAIQRRQDSLSALSLSAIALLIVNPYQLYSIGFQLSFVSCLGIILLYKGIWTQLKKAHIPLASAIAVSVSATVATFPLVIRYFGQLPLCTIIGNLIAVPAITVVLISSMIILPVAYVFPSLAKMLATMPKSILFCSEWLLGKLVRLPYAVVELRSANTLSCVLFLLMLFAISPYVLRKKQTKLLYFLAFMLMFTAVYIIGIM